MDTHNHLTAPRFKGPLKTLQLRLPEDLHKQLIQASDESFRSLNGEILWRLIQSFKREHNDGN